MSYQDFLKLPSDKQFESVQSQNQEGPRPLPEICNFEERGFLNFTSTQEGKIIKLETYRFSAKQNRGVVIFFHPGGAYIDSMGNTAKVLVSQGFTCVGYDQRGHGRSEGERGYFDDHKLIIQDARTFIREIFNIYKNIPIFLLGHTHGALFALTFAREFTEFKFSGLIMISPFLKKPNMSKFISAVSTVALNIMPRKTGLFEPDFKLATRNPNASDYLTKDPLTYHGKILVGHILEIAELFEKNEESTWKKIVTPPIVLIQGQNDKFCDPINSIHFYERIQTKDKELWWYPNMWNYFNFEPEVNEINERITKWLASKI